MGEKHTPTPWTYGWETQDRDWAIVTDANGRVVANVNTETGPDIHSAPAMRPMPAEHNAAFIVRAVNSHDKLVEALKAAKVVIEMMDRPAGIGSEVAAALDARCAKIDAALSRHGEGKP